MMCRECGGSDIYGPVSDYWGRCCVDCGYELELDLAKIMQSDFKFYLGTHMISHIEQAEFPMFVSIRRLRGRKKKPFNVSCDVCIDSGGFTELNLYGEWRTTPAEYLTQLDKLNDLGLSYEWASPQDYMCEDEVLEKTGLSVNTHQTLTVDNYIELRSKNERIIPVLQGQTLADYLSHLDEYSSRGIDLTQLSTVGVGSVCRRQSGDDILEVMQSLHGCGLKIHGFGVKTLGLKKYINYLKSSDSLAWSFNARKTKKKCSNCVEKNLELSHCGNCYSYAAEWREKLMRGIYEG